MRRKSSNGKKNSKQKEKPRGQKAPAESQQLLRLLDQLQYELLEGQFNSVLNTSQVLMNYLSPSSPHLSEVLLKRGTAFLALKEYDEAYDVLSKAAALAPNDGFLLYMYAQACMYAMRLGKVSVVIEKAVKSEPTLIEEESIKEVVDLIREGVKREIQLRGKGFTLEQLIKQEELENTGLQLLQARKIEEAEAVFRQVIAMGNVLPQPHNNLASCLIFQGRLAEAEQELLISLKIEPGNPVAANNLPG